MEQSGFLGRYQLGRVIGRGAMGVVYEAWDDKLKRKVAVKTILTSQLIDPQTAVKYSARFIQEAQNAAKLIHPNIVTVFDFGNDVDVSYLVMELIHGKELKAYLDEAHVFGIGEAVAIACQLLEALDVVHGKHIAHLDIKPANVMLETGTHRVRLTDFGVARVSGGGGPEGTRPGTMVGTPSFMSPEQIKGLVAGAAADLFATGVLLYQCLTLHKPFTGNSDWEIWQKIVNDDPPPMSSYRTQIPPGLEQAVRHALAKDPRERPPSARAMIDELNDAIGKGNFDPDATQLFSSTCLQPATLHDTRGSTAAAKGLERDNTGGGKRDFVAPRLMQEVEERQRQDEEARRRTEEELAREHEWRAAKEAARREAEEAASKAAATEAARKEAEEAASQAAEEAARQAAEDEAARKATEDLLARHRAAARKAAEIAARKKARRREAALARAKAEAGPMQVAPDAPGAQPGRQSDDGASSSADGTEAGPVIAPHMEQASPEWEAQSSLADAWWQARRLLSSKTSRLAAVSVAGVLVGFGLIMAIWTVTRFNE